MDEPTRPGHRSGFIAVAGKPNVGKSTLINRLVGQSIAAVSPRPQTTRRRQLGILTLPEAQIILLDTPGLHRPLHKLGARMNLAAESAIRDADALLVVFDASQGVEPEDTLVAGRVAEAPINKPVLLVLNKIDLVPAEQMPVRAQPLAALLPAALVLPVSALRGDGFDDLLAALVLGVPAGPQYFPADQVTDAFERDLAEDLIRAACMHFLRQEVPYSIAVRVEEFRERGEHGAYLSASLFVERESQKAIVVGKGGGMLKRIGTQARQAVEELTGRRVYLDLRVKVEPGWRDDEAALERFGYPAPGRPRS